MHMSFPTSCYCWKKHRTNTNTNDSLCLLKNATEGNKYASLAPFALADNDTQRPIRESSVFITTFMQTMMKSEGI